VPFKPHPTDPDKVVYAKAEYDLPVKKEWVGLTDEEISKIYASTDWNDNEDWDYERAIEAKLREKNFDRPS
jgi:hypothetical protein